MPKPVSKKVHVDFIELHQDTPNVYNIVLEQIKAVQIKDKKVKVVFELNNWMEEATNYKIRTLENLRQWIDLCVQMTSKITEEQRIMITSISDGGELPNGVNSFCKDFSEIAEIERLRNLEFSVEEKFTFIKSCHTHTDSLKSQLLLLEYLAFYEIPFKIIRCLPKISRKLEEKEVINTLTHDLIKNHLSTTDDRVFVLCPKEHAHPIVQECLQWARHYYTPLLLRLNLPRVKFSFMAYDAKEYAERILKPDMEQNLKKVQFQLAKPKINKAEFLNNRQSLALCGIASLGLGALCFLYRNPSLGCTLMDTGVGVLDKAVAVTSTKR